MLSSLYLVDASSTILNSPVIITRQISRYYQCPLRDNLVFSWELVVKQLGLTGFEVNSNCLIICSLLVFYSCCLFDLLLLLYFYERKTFPLLRTHVSTTFKNTLKGPFTHDQVDIFPRHKDGSLVVNQSPWYIISTKQRKKTYDRLSRCRKSIWQNSASLMIKTLNDVGLEGTYLNLRRALYEKLKANDILSDENGELFLWYQEQDK